MIITNFDEYFNDIFLEKGNRVCSSRVSVYHVMHE